LARFALIAVNLPVDREFTYRIPDHLDGRTQVGARVRVPFHGRKLAGVVVGLADETDVPDKRIKPVEAVLCEIPILPPDLLEFTRRMALEYACSWGTALEAALPGSLKRRGSRTVPGVDLVRSEDETLRHGEELEDKHPKQARVLRMAVEMGPPVPVAELRRRTGVSRSPIATLVKHGHLKWQRIEIEDELVRDARLERAPRHELTGEQQRAVDRVVAYVEAGEHRTFLLHGVTGSGKTEVYLRILETVRARDLSAIILVPEISLTPQTVGRFWSRFKDVAVLHSSLSDATRARQWLRIARGQSRIVVGARSALFAPVQDLGLIVVDEEHESSFKQQQSPRYHAREMAALRGSLNNAAVVLGSATPSLEAWSRCESGEYELVKLENRVGGGRLPKMLLVDMRHQKRVKGRPPLVSDRLEILMAERVKAGDQVLLFLNRRGYSPVLYCSACGDCVRCSSCDIPMVWHARRGRLTCHYCMAELRRPELCPSCEASVPVALGSGTERIEEWVRRRFPELVVARMDSDTMAKRDSYEKVLTAMRRGDIDVLVGTQMIAKGLDFPSVTLVGVVSAETGLFHPDFRAGERCFQMLAQVSGRAGRGEREGLVVVQTLCPDAEPIRRAMANDYEGFVRHEFALRDALGYPPAARLLRVIVESPDRNAAELRITELARELRDVVRADNLLGPAPAPLHRLRDRFRFHLILKFRSQRDFGRVRKRLVELESTRARCRTLVDVDPYSML